MPFHTTINTINGELRVSITERTSTGTVVRLTGYGPVGKSTVRWAMEDELRKRGCSIAFSDQELTKDFGFLPADRLVVDDAHVKTVISIFRSHGIPALRNAGLISSDARA
ncbi:hypothetical protein [Oleispirillum naphthae]|uniref:hypothetical protein n=1 Tax=Oleispirillum naphthae TaxID=2838853 RepID=UPI003082333B